MNTAEADFIMLVSVGAAGLVIASAMEEEEQRAKRSCWMKEYRETREEFGNTQDLMKELKPNTLDYKHFLRMDEDCFNLILSAIRSDIEKQNTRMRRAICPEEKLSVTLRFLATGESYKELDHNTKLSQSFLSRAIVDVCEAIYKNMKDQFLKFPDTKEQWTKIADDFNLKLQFPNCIGALDTKHIAFRPLRKNAPLFHNDKGFCSIILLGLADAYSKFIFIDVGCNGGISDGNVLQHSNFMHLLQQPEKFLPSEKLIGNSRSLPPVFVADNTFPLSNNMMTPYPTTISDESKIIFNYRLNQARQAIERAFSILTNRFRILQETINLQDDKVKKIVLCCCVLHNFLISRSRWYADTVEVNLSQESSDSVRTENQSNRQESKSGEAVRSELTNYFKFDVFSTYSFKNSISFTPIFVLFTEKQEKNCFEPINVFCI